MLEKRDFYALLAGQLVITLAIMVVVAKRHCLGDCDNGLVYQAPQAQALAASD